MIASDLVISLRASIRAGGEDRGGRGRPRKAPGALRQKASRVTGGRKGL